MVEKVELKIERIVVRIESLADIMFDRFIDHSKDKRPPEQKFYLLEENKLILPAENIKEGFLFGENPQGCAKAFEGKRGKDYIQAGGGHVFINPSTIPFLDEKEKEVCWEGFDNCRFWIHRGSGRTKQGSLSIKQEMKERPVLRSPWMLDFEVQIIENTFINSVKLYNWFVRGGLFIGMGTHRPSFGRFTVTRWDPIEEKKNKKK